MLVADVQGFPAKPVRQAYFFGVTFASRKGRPTYSRGPANSRGRTPLRNARGMRATGCRNAPVGPASRPDPGVRLLGFPGGTRNPLRNPAAFRPDPGRNPESAPESGVPAAFRPGSGRPSDPGRNPEPAPESGRVGRNPAGTRPDSRAGSGRDSGFRPDPRAQTRNAGGTRRGMRGRQCRDPAAQAGMRGRASWRVRASRWVDPSYYSIVLQ